jgi:hypothetical protein
MLFNEAIVLTSVSARQAIEYNVSPFLIMYSVALILFLTRLLSGVLAFTSTTGAGVSRAEQPTNNNQKHPKKIRPNT